MPHVQGLSVPDETCYDLVKEILRSALTAVQAKYGVVSLIRNDDGRVQNYVSHGLLPKRASNSSLVHWIASHGQPLALKTRKDALLASDFQYLQAVEETARLYFDQHKDLNQPMLGALGLATTVREKLKQLKKETGCQVDFRLADWPNLPRHVEVAIYRIIQEALNNVRKHAKSSKLEVELTREKERLVIRVKVRGIGFIPDKKEPTFPIRSLGLYSMRRRAEFLGGTFKINSSLGAGTEIIVAIPWTTEQG